jgi:DNA-binding PadR family transcriptional regulator
VTERDFDVQAFARDINELLVLSTLRAGAKHGYQIGLDVETESNGLFRFRHGTLYPILHRLEGEGLIRGSWSKEGGRRRKVYSLTGTGERHLSGETNRVQEIVSRLMHFLRHPGEAPA